MTIPVVTPPETVEDPGTVIGVVLAAGTGSRFGAGNKLLATVGGDPLVRRAVRTLLDARVDGVVIVVGYEADKVREAVADLPVDVVENPDFTEGQATSVRVGIEAVRESADAVVFALGDMPWIRPESVNAVLGAYAEGAGAIVAAAFEGQRGNPVLFDATFFDQLADVSGDTGAREVLLRSDDAVLVETGDPGVTADVDTSADLDRLQAEKGPGTAE